MRHNAIFCQVFSPLDKAIEAESTPTFNKAENDSQNCNAEACSVCVSFQRLYAKVVFPRRPYENEEKLDVSTRDSTHNRFHPAQPGGRRSPP